jgi:hypothetical protein
VAGRLGDELRRVFGRSAVFMDVESIPPGQNFVKVLEDALRRCRVMLVVVGPTWLTALGEDGGRRIDDPADFVHREVVLGLERPDLPVVPVLVGGASLPADGDLPERLAGLSARQARRLENESFREQAAAIVSGIEKVVPRRRRVLAPALILLALVIVGVAGALALSSKGRTPASTPAIAGKITGLEFAKNVTLRQYLADNGESSARLSAAQLAQGGNVLVVHVRLRGYANQTVSVHWSLHEASSDKLLTQRAYRQTERLWFVPRSSDHAGTGRLWIPIPNRDGRYYVSVELRDQRNQTPDSRKSPVFVSTRI